jgi:hypothetical protein
MEHGFKPPVASYSTENTIRPGVVVHLFVIVENVS